MATGKPWKWLDGVEADDHHLAVVTYHGPLNRRPRGGSVILEPGTGTASRATGPPSLVSPGRHPGAAHDRHAAAPTDHVVLDRLAPASVAFMMPGAFEPALRAASPGRASARANASTRPSPATGSETGRSRATPNPHGCRCVPCLPGVTRPTLDRASSAQPGALGTSARGVAPSGAYGHEQRDRQRARMPLAGRGPHCRTRASWGIAESASGNHSSRGAPPYRTSA